MSLKFHLRPAQALAGAAALMVLLSAMFLPWHDIISGDEQIAPERMPQTRQSVAQAQTKFEQANARYQDYIKTNDLGALHDTLLWNTASLQSELISQDTSVGTVKTEQDQLKMVAGLGQQLENYANVLRDYAAASDAYLSSLQTYDDDLMSWTRGLFGASESLRSQTWPFVEHLKLYPEPVGLKTDPPMVSASQVERQIETLRDHRAAIQVAIRVAPSGDTLEALKGIESDVAAIWESGRSVEYMAGLHTEYKDELAAYDAKVAQAAQDPQAATPQVVSPAYSWGLTLLVTALTLAGLAALFMPRFKTETAT